MALRAWRARGRLLVECDACSSRGHPGRAETQTVEDPGRAAARAALQAEANKLRATTDGSVAATMRLHGLNQLTKEEAARRVKETALRHGAALKDILSRAPPIGDGALEKLTQCPWCDAPGDAVVASLGDDEAEPAHWLAATGA